MRKEKPDATSNQPVEPPTDPDSLGGVGYYDGRRTGLLRILFARLEERTEADT